MRDQLRRDFRKLRATIPLDVAIQASKDVAHQVALLLDLLPQKPKVISAYHAIHHELDLQFLIDQLSRQGYLFVFPQTQGEQMRFYCEERQVDPDLILAPLLCCDRFGNRLGYGKGYYDREIVRLREKTSSLVVAGVCYQVQIVQELTAQKHDQALDCIVTESEVISINHAITQN